MIDHLPVPRYPRQAVRRPNSIIRDACDIRLLPPADDMPIEGGPADPNFIPYESDGSEVQSCLHKQKEKLTTRILKRLRKQ